MVTQSAMKLFKAASDDQILLHTSKARWVSEAVKPNTLNIRIETKRLRAYTVLKLLNTRSSL
jgi:hypothetical protein